MPDEKTHGQQRYDLNELESAAVFAVTEVEGMTETLAQSARVPATVHSPEAAWNDPVRLIEHIPRGGLVLPVDFGDAKTVLFIARDDAALLAALLKGAKGRSVTQTVKGGLKEEAAGALADLAGKVFIPRGGNVGTPVIARGDEQMLPALQETVGASFMCVRVTMSLEGYSDGYMYRLYDRSFVEAHFRGAQTSVAVETQLLPATSFEKLAAPQEQAELAAPVAPEERAAAVKRLVRISVTLRVLLAGRRMLLRDLVKLLPGEVVPFEKKVSEAADVMLNSHVIAGGEVVRSGRHYGIKLRKIASVKDRLKSLGSP